MNFNWLNKKNNKKLILFFNGWGMDDCVVRHLAPGVFDVLTICDYNSLMPLPGGEGYDDIYIIAWSMGVMIASMYKVNCTGATAVNGTLYPINAEYGINPRVYNLMVKGFDALSRDKFIANMFDKIPEGFIAPSRSIENQKSELSVLKQYSGDEKFKYTRVIVSDNDKIIPTSSQLRFWETAEIIKSGHCPFFNYQRWEELL